jgi:glycerol-3-phosphate dehydrogenase
MNVVIDRRLSDTAIGVQARSGAAQDPVGGGHRFLFVVPQGRRSVLGTRYAITPDGDLGGTEAGVRSLVREFNEVCPGVQLSRSDVVRTQRGWLPLKNGIEPGRANALAERPRIVDYAKYGVRHVLSVEGVKYTTGRRVAEGVLDWLFSSLARTSPPCRTAEVRLEASPRTSSLQTDGTVAMAAVVHAIHEEMAVKLSDIVFRRTDLADVAPINRSLVEDVARQAGAELGWNTTRHEAEVEDVMRQFGVPGPALEVAG